MPGARSGPPVKWSAALVITLKRGLAGKRWDQRATVEALGLGKRESLVVKPNNSSVLGMIEKVKRLVQVETLEMYKSRIASEQAKKAWQPPLRFHHQPLGTKEKPTEASGVPREA